MELPATQLDHSSPQLQECVVEFDLVGLRVHCDQNSLDPRSGGSDHPDRARALVQESLDGRVVLTILVAGDHHQIVAGG